MCSMHFQRCYINVCLPLHVFVFHRIQRKYFHDFLFLAKRDVSKRRKIKSHSAVRQSSSKFTLSSNNNNDLYRGKKIFAYIVAQIPSSDEHNGSIIFRCATSVSKLSIFLPVVHHQLFRMVYIHTWFILTHGHIPQLECVSTLWKLFKFLSN